MFHNTGRAVGLITPVVIALLAGLTVVATAAQEEAEAGGGDIKTVWDGVFTAEQAARGRARFEGSCSECHSTGEAPEIAGTTFIRSWFEDSLNLPFTKMRETMPGDAPGSLSDETYIDILSFLLEASGFPAGVEPLTADPDQLASILVVDKGGPGGPVPNFTLVQLVGCLSQEGDGVLILTNGSRPVRTRLPGDSPPADLQALAGSALGTQTLRLISAPAPAQRRDLLGRLVQIKGFLIRNPNGDRLNVTALQSVSESCTE